uniref:Cleavage induced predicted protein putative n=1 Tax=Albugo laibachii Nc14 TaxID=890382 RepID=F0W4P0_9STRA|nr:cleavage induced predicted protein putative [Albugo laibachii Nc14]|eukprot:CCA16074.1 cleavage induced predicted protein putative [Albugo laibachii Nc14]
MGGKDLATLAAFAQRGESTSAHSHRKNHDEEEEKHHSHVTESYTQIWSAPKHARAQRSTAESTTPVHKTFRDYLQPIERDTVSPVQLKLLKATLAPEPPKKAPHNTDRTNELACPRLETTRNNQCGFASFDDVKNCRFRPRLRGGKHVEADEEESSDRTRTTAFIRRMEGSERVRKENLDRMREGKVYSSQIDKKECPQCGNPQSYAEVKQKRNKCPNCNDSYRLRMNDIASSFLKKLDAQTSLARNTKEGDLCANPMPRCRKWHEVEDEFLGRVYLDLARRKSDHSALLQEQQKECTFHPVICRGSQKVHHCLVYLNLHVSHFIEYTGQSRHFPGTTDSRFAKSKAQRTHSGAQMNGKQYYTTTELFLLGALS